MAQLNDITRKVPFRKRSKSISLSSAGRKPGAVPAISVTEALTIPYGPLRNHAVTYSYQWVSERVADRIGMTDVNWCTFAAWASRSVGHVLDDRELPYGIERKIRWIPGPVLRVFERIARTVRSRVFRRNAQSLVEGNTAVFHDIARRFLGVLDFLGTSGPEVDRKFEDWLAAFEPPEGRTDMATQLEDIRNAFRLYRRASLLEPSIERAELSFVAGALVGSYEQMLLQPVLERTLYVHTRFGSLLSRLITRIVSVYTPNRILRVVKPPQAPRGVAVTINRAAPVTPEAKSLFDRFPEPGTNREHRMIRWSDYPRRMNWIVEYFRVHHLDSSFFVSPFAYDDSELESKVNGIIVAAIRDFGVGVGDEERASFESRDHGRRAAAEAASAQAATAS